MKPEYVVRLDVFFLVGSLLDSVFDCCRAVVDILLEEQFQQLADSDAAVSVFSTHEHYQPLTLWFGLD